MRIAVIGGGIFGCTAAIHAARAGHEVHLFEAKDDILRGATGHNQARLHEGYHYPRSPETARACQDGNRLFRREYGPAVIKDGLHIYVIARDSKTLPWEFINFCRALDLDTDSNDLLVRQRIDARQLTVCVKEARIDIDILRALVAHKLLVSGVKVRLGEHANRHLLQPNGFDFVILATYADWINGISLYQYEVCEEVILRMPEGFGDTSIVIIDGEFCCLDPIGRTGLHMLAHVKHSIHASNIGYRSEIPVPLRPHINAGIRYGVKESKHPVIVRESARYIPTLNEAEYVGSMFTVKAVLPDQDATDARPTLVERVDDQVIRIFSGKIGTCVQAAMDAVDMIDGRAREAA